MSASTRAYGEVTVSPTPNESCRSFSALPSTRLPEAFCSAMWPWAWTNAAPTSPWNTARSVPQAGNSRNDTNARGDGRRSFGSRVVLQSTPRPASGIPIDRAFVGIGTSAPLEAQAAADLPAGDPHADIEVVVAAA